MAPAPANPDLPAIRVEERMLDLIYLVTLIVVFLGFAWLAHACDRL